MKARSAIWFALACGATLLFGSYLSPAVSDYVQKFQTMLAAIIAGVAAATAFEGAMLKIDFDRRIARRDAISKKLGVFLKLCYSLNSLKFHLNKYVETVQRKDASIKASDMRITLPEEIDEAWEKLEYLPKEAAFRLGLLRLGRNVHQIEDLYPKGKVFSVADLQKPDEGLENFIAVCKGLLEDATKITDELDKAITELRELEPEI